MSVAIASGKVSRSSSKASSGSSSSDQTTDTTSLDSYSDVELDVFEYQIKKNFARKRELDTLSDRSFTCSPYPEGITNDAYQHDDLNSISDAVTDSACGSEGTYQSRSKTNSTISDTAKDPDSASCNTSLDSALGMCCKDDSIGRDGSSVKSFVSEDGCDGRAEVIVESSGATFPRTELEVVKSAMSHGPEVHLPVQKANAKDLLQMQHKLSVKHCGFVTIKEVVLFNKCNREDAPAAVVEDKCQVAKRIEDLQTQSSNKDPGINVNLENGEKPTENEEPNRRPFIKRVQHFCSSHPVIAAVACVTVCLLVIAVGVMIPFLAAPNVLSKYAPTNPDNLVIIPKGEWENAYPNTENFVPLDLPVQYVLITHTFSDPCFTLTKCVNILRNIQAYHIVSRHYPDIGYNYMIGGDGYVYEGRGWGNKSERATGILERSVSLSMIGRFTSPADSLPERQVKALKKLIELGLSLGTIHEDYVLVALCQLDASNGAPGFKVVEVIKHWPHFEVKQNCSSIYKEG